VEAGLSPLLKGIAFKRREVCGSEDLFHERNEGDSTHVLVCLRRALRSQLVPGDICIVTATDEVIADGFGQILFWGSRLDNLESVIIVDNLQELLKFVQLPVHTLHRLSLCFLQEIHEFIVRECFVLTTEVIVDSLEVVLDLVGKI
jgi:hypothetical protein